MNTCIKGLFSKKGGYLLREDINSRPLYYQILKLVDSGEVIRLKKGIYCLEESIEKNIIDIEKIVPGGVLCLYSAWAYYNLTTQIASSYCIAIGRMKKFKLPNYPPIKLHNWKDKLYELGITNVTIEGVQVRIYDIEKSVCDAIKFRNKIGLDVCAEILKSYLERQDRNITKLMNYAKEMRVATTLTNYLEIAL